MGAGRVQMYQPERRWNDRLFTHRAQIGRAYTHNASHSLKRAATMDTAPSDLVIPHQQMKSHKHRVKPVAATSRPPARYTKWQNMPRIATRAVKTASHSKWNPLNWGKK